MATPDQEPLDLVEALNAGRISRRDFVRRGLLLGVSIPTLTGLLAACGGDVISVDWRIPLDRAWQRIGLDRPIQGNLDPAALLAPWPELKWRIDDVLLRADGHDGHIFNLGHGILPTTPVDNVRRLVDYIHEQTAGRKS